MGSTMAMKPTMPQKTGTYDVRSAKAPVIRTAAIPAVIAIK